MIVTSSCVSISSMRFPGQTQVKINESLKNYTLSNFYRKNHKIKLGLGEFLRTRLYVLYECQKKKHCYFLIVCVFKNMKLKKPAGVFEELSFVLIGAQEEFQRTCCELSHQCVVSVKISTFVKTVSIRVEKGTIPKNSIFFCGSGTCTYSNLRNSRNLKMVVTS